MQKFRMFSKAWWGTVLVLFISVTLLFPYTVQADPGPKEPPRQKTTMFAEMGIFYTTLTYTVLLEIPHTDELAVVYIASGSDWLGWFFEDQDWEIYQLHQPIWTHDRCARHDKISVSASLFEGHLQVHPYWYAFKEGLSAGLIPEGVDFASWAAAVLKNGVSDFVSGAATAFKALRVLGSGGSGEVIGQDTILVDLDNEEHFDYRDTSQSIRFESPYELPDGSMIDLFRGQLWLFTKNEEVQDTTGLCTPECLDSDGNNITEYGLVSGIDTTGEYKYFDTCLGEEAVKEWTCNENNLPTSEDVDCPPDYHCSTYLGMGKCSDIGDGSDEIIKCSENDLILFEGTWEDGLIGFKYPPGSVICSPEDDCPEGSTCNFDACFCLPDGGWEEILKGGELSEPLPTTKAPTPTPESPTATPEPEDTEVSVGELFGGHECGAQCRHLGMVYIQTNSSVPVANATVTIRMTGPGGIDEVTTVVTGLDGVADFSFPAQSHDNHTLTVENIEAEGLAYDPAQNQASSVVVGTVPQGLPERATLPVNNFIEPFVAGMASGDTEFLLERLHPAVIEIYGKEQCSAYLETVSDPTFKIELLSASGPSPWEWVIDDISTSIPNSYLANINLISRGTTSTIESHFALDDQNRMSWFTDCGDPLN